MAWADLDSIQDPSAGATLLSAWGDQINLNFDVLRNPPRVAVNNSYENIPNNAATFATFNAEYYDTDSMHESVTNPTRVTINTAGLYQVVARVEFGDAANRTGDRFIQLYLNAATLLGNTSVPCITGTGTGGTAFQYVLDARNFVATDYLRLSVFQDSGVAISTLCVLSALFVCP